MHTGWWAVARELVGDAPDKYNPKYVMAVLSSEIAARVNQEVERAAALPMPQWVLPKVAFTTDEFTRRSMTLNAMRMSTEYFARDSPRVLQLIEQRLRAGQRDVAHDVLVYLMQQILDVRAHAREARLLRAEAVAAYLGLDQTRVNSLFLSPRLAPLQIAADLKAGVAGEIRRTLDVPALLESQAHHLRPALRRLHRQERHVLRLIDDVTLRLYEDTGV